jgi:hypothetical protein
MPRSFSSVRRLVGYQSRLVCPILAVLIIVGLRLTAVRVLTQEPVPQIIQVTDTTAGQAPTVDFPTFVSQDGSLVAFVLHESLSDWYSDVRLYIGSTDATSPPRRITPPGLNVRSFFSVPPSFGSKIAFFACDNVSCQTSNAGIPGDVYVVGTDGAGLTRLTFDAPPGGTFSPVWYEDVIVSGTAGRLRSLSKSHPLQILIRSKSSTFISSMSMAQTVER